MASRIPDDLLEDIRKRLSTKTDVSRFRAVCKSWRSLIPPLEKQRIQFPIIVSWRHDEYTITESVVYHLAPPGDPCERGWLMKVKEGRCGKTHMLDPLSQLKVYRLPESFPKVLNLLDNRVFEVSRTYDIQDSKVVMSLDLDSFPVFMFIYIGTLYYGKFGFEDEKSIQVRKFTSGCKFMYFKDVIFYKGKFYAVSKYGEIVVVVDSCLNGTLLEPKLVSSGSHLFPGEKKVSRKLVESGGYLLLSVKYLVKMKQHNTKSSADKTVLDRYSSEKIKKKHYEFRVYKLSGDNKEWRELQEEALSDRILILGDDCNYSVSRLDYPGYTGNIIYTALKFRKRRWSHNLEAMFRGIGVFGLSSDRCGTLRSCKTLENIFYPPETHCQARILV